MIIERMQFSLQFGKAKESIQIWKQIMDCIKTMKNGNRMRMLTDMSGPSYTLIIEFHYNSMLDYGPNQYNWMTNETIRDLYSKFIPLCNSANRTLYKIENEI